MKIKKIFVYILVIVIFIIIFLLYKQDINLLFLKVKNFISIINLVPWLITNNGYWVFYLLTLIDSTIITAAASVVASFGYYNIVIIILISIVGDLTGDIAYYLIGRSVRSIKGREKYIFGIRREQTNKIKSMIHENFWKTVLIVKISPIITNPGLIIIGASGAPIKKFIKTATLVAIPKTLFFALFGFLSGKTYIYLQKTITNTSYIIISIILFFILLSFIYKKITNKIVKNMSAQ